MYAVSVQHHVWDYKSYIEDEESVELSVVFFTKTELFERKNHELNVQISLDKIDWQDKSKTYLRQCAKGAELVSVESKQCR